MGWMDRWAAAEQRRSDQRQVRWLARRRERAASGRLTLMDRWAAYEQHKSDHLLADSKALYRLRPQVPSAPVEGADGRTAVIRVEQTGAWWLRWWTKPVPSTGGGGGGVLAVPLLLCLLVTEAIWMLVFHRGYTVHVRTDGQPPVKLSIRMPDEVAAYRLAAELISEFRAEGTAALQRPRPGVAAGPAR